MAVVSGEQDPVHLEGGGEDLASSLANNILTNGASSNVCTSSDMKAMHGILYDGYHHRRKCR